MKKRLAATTLLTLLICSMTILPAHAESINADNGLTYFYSEEINEPRKTLHDQVIDEMKLEIIDATDGKACNEGFIPQLGHYYQLNATFKVGDLPDEVTNRDKVQVINYLRLHLPKQYDKKETEIRVSITNESTINAWLPFVSAESHFRADVTTEAPEGTSTLLDIKPLPNSMKILRSSDMSYVVLSEEEQEAALSETGVRITGLLDSSDSFCFTAYFQAVQPVKTFGADYLILFLVTILLTGIIGGVITMKRAKSKSPAFPNLDETENITLGIKELTSEEEDSAK